MQGFQIIMIIHLSQINCKIQLHQLVNITISIIKIFYNNKLILTIFQHQKWLLINDNNKTNKKVTYNSNITIMKTKILSIHKIKNRIKKYLKIVI